MTLDKFVSEICGRMDRRQGEGDLPESAIGFRLKRGRVVWTDALYPDGSDGNKVMVARIVHENGKAFTRVTYYDRDTEIEFVYKE